MAAQQQVVYQALWPAYPLTTVPYQVSVPPGPPSYLARDYAGPMLQQGVIPYFYNASVVKNTRQEESRKFFLDRSVFDLVDAHRYLALTDQKLLSWYLCLSPEDRKIIQDEGNLHMFLQRHPALGLSRHHVYVKFNSRCTSPAQPAMTSNKQTSIKSGAKKCRCGLPNSNGELNVIPANVMDSLALLGCCNRDGSLTQPQEEVGHSDQLLSLQDGFTAAFSGTNTPEMHHNVQGSSVYQLDGQSPLWQMAFSGSDDPAAISSGFSADMDTGRLPHTARPEPSSHFTGTHSQSHGFPYAEVDPMQTEWPLVEKDSSSPSELYVFDSGHVDGTRHSNNYLVQPAEAAKDAPLSPDPGEDHEEDGVVVGVQGEGLPSVMADDRSILVCVATEDVTTSVDTAERSTSPPARATTAGTAPCVETSTQTDRPTTADKNLITEVHMSDLDYLAEEFIKLKMAKVEPREHKEKMKRPGSKVRRAVGCVPRAQQAELCSLLALQYQLCKQHIWRQSAALTSETMEPPANIVGIQQKLQRDYHEIRKKILAGVPVDKLKPLSVDREKTTTGGSSIPAQTSDDEQRKVPSCSPQEPQEQVLAEENPCSDNQSRNVCEDIQEEIKPIDTTQKTEDKQSTAPCKEPSNSEAWYDAEEDLEQSDKGQQPPEGAKDTAREPERQAIPSSVLCVSNLPSDVTETDVKQWFEKYQASEVYISALEKDCRVAIVQLAAAQCVDAAVGEMNGCRRDGARLTVERVNVAVARRETDTHTTQASDTESNTERKPVPPSPSRPHTQSAPVVFTHYGTMGSFDFLMSELTQRHPGVDRQAIVGALTELRAKHVGSLSTLPLGTIREMTSEILTRPHTDTPL